jgi:hypothetical protein
VVVRLEAWPSTVAHAAAPEPSVVFEHERLPDGVWLERLVRIKTYGHRDVFNRLELDFTKEAADFKRFTADAATDALDAPKKQPEPRNPPHP